MNYILFDSDVRDALLPFTYTRPVADIRVGILTIREKWEKRLGLTTTTITEEYLSEKYPMVEFEHNILLNASFLPTDELVELIKNLKEQQAIFKGDDVVAFYTTNSQEEVKFEGYEPIEYEGELLKIEHTWDIFALNAQALQQDFDFITKDRLSQPIPDTVQCINKDNIFIEEGAKLTYAILNASSAPIYIGKNAEIMEGCMVRDGLAMCEHSVLKMGTKIYGATTLGPHVKVGGEVSNSVIFGYSNKGHDGFLGNSVIGEWCNLGADTNNSNLKNNYSKVKLWSYQTKTFENTGLQFCGLMMGDHSKSGINTMFNTGTVVGVSSNIYGGDFSRNFIPSFSWGGASGFTEFRLDKAFEVAKQMMKRRHIDFDDTEQKILKHIFEQTKEYRNKN